MSAAALCLFVVSWLVIGLLTIRVSNRIDPRLFGDDGDALHLLTFAVVWPALLLTLAAPLVARALRAIAGVKNQ